jgi:hypothetical protein
VSRRQRYLYREQAPLYLPPDLFDKLRVNSAKGVIDASRFCGSLPPRKSLEVYQHLSLDTVEQAYQEAVRSIGL